ncbi:MAG: arginine--tRNA ligase [Pseudomonadales bacterium]|nr:arginine--tRNA ligase [Pseudomonadales bacterium]
MNVKKLLTERFAAAFRSATGEAIDPVIQTSGKPELGEYQANGAMAAARRLGLVPRELAAKVIERAQVADLAEGLDVAGPGFINIRLHADFLSRQLGAEFRVIQQASEALRIVVDYSSPNLAKEMHVGHLRSTIIGDALARILEALGHVVIRQNHVGDWGTQFGMLLAYLDESGGASDELADLETFYRSAKTRFDSDAEFAERARARVVKLQSGDAATRAEWQRFIEISLSHCQAIYDRLGVTLTRRDVMAESAYNDDLPGIVEALRTKKLLVESEGAQCVFLDEFKGKDGQPLPVIVQKTDGGYLYATTDLAAVRYRSQTLRADRALYLTDARQALHFRQIFAVAARAGFTSNAISLEHQPFGNMLGKDGKPFKTRQGGVVKLNELLDEAESRALALVRGKNPELGESECREIARVVGIGSVKYADLSKNRTSDYVFDWDQMLSFEGNTAPYLQYAYSRIRSLFRRGEVAEDSLAGTPDIKAAEERALAVALLRFQEVVDQVALEGFPHLLCAYLYELAAAFTRFYEACPILNQAEPIRDSRLLLSGRVAETLHTGLDLLGIETTERM